MDMSVQKVKKIKKKLLGPAREELREVKSAAVKQVTGKDGSKTSANQQSAVVEAMQQKSTSDEDKKVDLRKHKSIFERQEDDEKKAGQARAKLEKAMREIRDPEDNEVESKPGQPIEGVPMPASRPSRGTLPGASKSPEQIKRRH